MTLAITLPFPPSVNRYWRHLTRGKLAGRVLISEEGRAYREAIVATIRQLSLGGPLLGRLCVELVAHPPDRRQRDLDNLLKATLDGLQHARVYGNDGQIDRLVITRGDVVRDGFVEVVVREIQPPQGSNAAIATSSVHQRIPRGSRR